jgi:hypothetical protein
VLGTVGTEATVAVAKSRSWPTFECDLGSNKAIDLDLRPIHHWTETRVRSHVFICMLAAHLTWHLRRAYL